MTRATAGQEGAWHWITCKTRGNVGKKAARQSRGAEGSVVQNQGQAAIREKAPRLTRKRPEAEPKKNYAHQGDTKDREHAAEE